MMKALQSVFDVCGTQAQLIVRGRNNTIVTKIWGYENVACGANIGDLHAENLRVLLCDFTVSGTVPEGTEVEVLDYQLKYNQPANVNSEPSIVSGTLTVKFVNDESLVQQVDPRVKTLHAVQVAAEMDDRIAQLITERKRTDAVALINEQIALLKAVENLDDEKGMIRMLVGMAEGMQQRLKDQTVSEETAAKHYGHHGHMKKCHDYKYTKHYGE
ncbi:unnamed protein product [Didymodactylos carnosus]|nr:unnamed protein product [Didymodactylos carnosus]CAF4408829.1 unnamed protein product [Didymodactylos carnosus]